MQNNLSQILKDHHSELNLTSYQIKIAL